MNVSGPVQIFALVAVILGVVAASAMMFLGPSGGGGSAAGELDGVQLDAQGRVISAPKSANSIAKKANSRIAAPKTAVKPPSAAVPKKPARSAVKPRKPVAQNGLPRIVADALIRHSTVVVALYTPRGKTDPLGFVEARQGAALARVGFVAVNVFDTTTAAPLMRKLGVVLRAPAVLVFRRSGDLATRIDGFADRQTVAQAAQNAET